MAVVLGAGRLRFLRGARFLAARALAALALALAAASSLDFEQPPQATSESANDKSTR